MKQLFLSLLVLASLSCGRKKAVDPLNPMGNCLPLTEAYSNAASKYYENPNRQNCQALLKGLDDLINKCDILTAEQKKEYRQNRADMTCD